VVLLCPALAEFYLLVVENTLFHDAASSSPFLSPIILQ
jgi:hypothetical protein